MDKRKFRFISDLISCQKEMFGGKSKALKNCMTCATMRRSIRWSNNYWLMLEPDNAFAKQSYRELSQLYRQSILN